MAIPLSVGLMIISLLCVKDLISLWTNLCMWHLNGIFAFSTYMGIMCEVAAAVGFVLIDMYTKC